MANIKNNKRYNLVFNMEREDEKALYENMEKYCREQDESMRQFIFESIREKLMRIEHDEDIMKQMESDTITVKLEKTSFYNYVNKQLTKQLARLAEEEEE